MGKELKLSDVDWKIWHIYEEDILVGFKIPGGGQITILDRETGYGGGIRDVETGYKDKDGNFWLASCRFDIREFPYLTVSQAILRIKQNANTCVGGQ